MVMHGYGKVIATVVIRVRPEKPARRSAKLTGRPAKPTGRLTKPTGRATKPIGGASRPTKTEVLFVFPMC